MDERGLLFVSEKTTHCVRMIDLQTGIIQTIIGRDNAKASGTAGDGVARMIYLNQPHDLALDPEGDLYVTSSRAHKVYKYPVALALQVIVVSHG